jgi:hypothetical protein
MLSVVASLALLASMSALGIALLDRYARHLAPLERIAYGAPLGMVIGTLAFVPVSTLIGFRVEGVVLVGGVCLVLGAWLLRGSSGPGSLGAEATRIRPIRAALRRISWLPTLVIGAFAVRWAIFWRDAMTYTSNGLYAGHINLWGDWPVHLGIVSSFVYGANFPPEHPRFAGHAFAYHYLSDLTAAAQVTLGMDPAGALALHSYVGCVLVAIGLYAFARRFTRDRGAATLTLVLFMLGGGLGWLATAAAMEQSHDILGTISTLAWERHVKSDLNLQFVNMFFGFLASQRAFLYGLPLAFAIVSTLLVAVRRADVRLFVLAGVIAGLLPLAHLGTLLALAIVTPFLFLLFPSRAWFAFFAIWVAVALPQLLPQLGGGAGALSTIRLQPGWVSAPDSWIWFWLKNLGWFAPLLIAGLVARRLMPERAHRFMWAFMVLFAAVNLVVFQPWDWDNHKLLVYWFLAVCVVVGALLARTWRRHPDIGARTLVAGVIVSMVLSGVLEDVGTLLGQSRYRMLVPDQLTLAAEVRARTDPDALFIVGMENHDPIAMLTGRRIYVGYGNWLWTEGIPYEGRTAEALSILRAEPGSEARMAAIGIDYVVIGPHERDQLGANEAAFKARYPVLVQVGEWTVYDVRGAHP